MMAINISWKCWLLNENPYDYEEELQLMPLTNLTYMMRHLYMYIFQLRGHSYITVSPQ